METAHFPHPHRLRPTMLPSHGPRINGMDDCPPTHKLAIPRLGRSDHDRKPPRIRHSKPRVRKACNNCHMRKVGCTGEQPHCRNCVDQHRPCVYPLARRDRLKDVTEQNSQLIALLRDLSVHVDNGGQTKIDELFDSFEENGSAHISAMAPESLGKRSREESSSNEGGAADVSGSMGFEDGPHLQDENLLRNNVSRATGFVGQNSEVQWLRNLKTQMASATSEGWRGAPYGLPYKSQDSNKEAVVQQADALRTRQEPPKLGSISHVSDFTFYLDSDDLDVDVMVDPYELPPPETAEKLFDCYMETVHSSFPIVPGVFKDQFRKYSNSVKQNRRFQVPEHWQVTLNLVLAIGAQYSHLMQAGWQADERDHLIYMTRAIRILGLDKIATSLHAPSLSIIRATGLLSLYYLTVGHVSRAWMMIGTSLRFALAVGLHLRNDDPSASPNIKESLVRTWWSLHSIESQLCALIGRPCIIPYDECTVPLPQVIPEEQCSNSAPPQLRNPIGIRSEITALSETSSSDTASRGEVEAIMHIPFLQARTKIAIIMQKALSKLYMPRTSTNSWERIHKEITSLTGELDEWVTAALPGGLSPVDSVQEHDVQHERLLLSFHYYSARLLISRPSLCRLERRIKGQSHASAAFNQKTAEACVQAAQAVTRLFPDQPDWMFICQRSPWWCIVHYMMQAIAVFLLEMSFEGTDTTQNGEELSESIEKLVRWLRFMSSRNVVAERAYKVILDITKTGAPRVQTDRAELVVEGQAIPPFNHPTATTNAGTQSATSFEEEQLVQGSGEFQPDQYFMRDPALQMPSIFGTPFVTDFDEFNLLNTTLFPDGHPIREDTWMWYANLSLENNQEPPA